MVSSVNNQIDNLKEKYTKENLVRSWKRIKQVIKIFEKISIEKAARLTNRIKRYKTRYDIGFFNCNFLKRKTIDQINKEMVALTANILNNSRDKYHNK